MATDKIAREVGRWRRLLRTHVERSGLSRETIAQKAKLTLAEVEEVLEDRPVSPAIEDLHAVLRALGKEPGEFFGELYEFAPRGRSVAPGRPEAAGMASGAEDLRGEFYGALESFSKAAQCVASLLVRMAELGEDFGLSAASMMPIVESVDELARRVADLRPPEDAWE